MRITIVTGGSVPAFSRVKDLFQNTDFLIAADSGLDSCELWNQRPDMVLGDMDSLKNKELLNNIPSEKKIKFPEDKDFSDTEIAIREGLKKSGEITLVGGGEGRLDHSLAILALFKRYPQPVRWITAREDIFRLTDRMVFDGYIGRRLSLFPLTDGGLNCTSRGLHWELSPEVFQVLNFSLSNKIVTDQAEISVVEGEALLILPFDDPF